VNRSTVYTIDYIEAPDPGWWVINKAITMCAADCQHMHDLRLGAKIFYFADYRKCISNGEYPVAIVRDAEGAMLYESAGHRMCRIQAEPKHILFPKQKLQ